MSRTSPDLAKMIENKPLIMGVVNVTPDSFSDGGDYYSPENAIKHGLQLLEQGADIIDIGGESTRPGAETVPVDEEIRRILPVIQGLSNKSEFISIDTRNAATMDAALKAGANIINDVTALTHDPASMDVAARHDMPVCLMHSKGNPKTMQKAPTYANVVDEVLAYLKERIEECVNAGIKSENIIVDPGIGFGKTVHHNLALLKNLKEFESLGYPILLGTSRKSFIPKVSEDNSTSEQRIGGSLSSVIWGYEQGVRLFRVHDVFETAQALKIYSAIKSA